MFAEEPVTPAPEFKVSRQWNDGAEKIEPACGVCARQRAATLRRKTSPASHLLNGSRTSLLRALLRTPDFHWNRQVIESTLRGPSHSNPITCVRYTYIYNSAIANISRARSLIPLRNRMFQRRVRCDARCDRSVSHFSAFFFLYHEKCVPPLSPRSIAARASSE